MNLPIGIPTLSYTEKVIRIAHIVYEANRALGMQHGDMDRAEWYSANDIERSTMITAVEFYLEKPKANEEECHNHWLYMRTLEGWKYGKERNNDKKTHPSMVQYGNLTDFERYKVRQAFVLIRLLVAEYYPFK